jgi:hypothetical protein
LALLQGFGWLIVAFSIVLIVKGERSIMLAGAFALAVPSSRPAGVWHLTGGLS